MLFAHRVFLLLIILPVNNLKRPQGNIAPTFAKMGPFFSAKNSSESKLSYCRQPETMIPTIIQIEFKGIKTTSFTPPSEVVLIVLTSVTDQK
jgi:hypothetical protein